MITQTKAPHVGDLHLENKLWLNELNFAADELRIFEGYLEELVTRGGGREILAQVEQYQNQFIREKEVIDILKHDINRHEHKLVEFAKRHPVTFGLYEMEDHHGMREAMERFRKIFNELKANFFQFRHQWKA
jgi:hypothetical protein